MTDLADLARRQTSQFEIRAQEKGIKIYAVVPRGLPKINVNPSRMEQILGNLITNAIRHTPPGGRIKVSINRLDKDLAHQINAPSLILSVADTGEGIAPEHLTHIFERFYRVDVSRVRKEGGFGLGLAIVQTIGAGS